MNGLRSLSNVVFQLLFLSLMFAVLWVKGYLWWVFFIALGLFLLTMLPVPSHPPPEAGPSQPVVPPKAGRASSAQTPDEREYDSLREPRPPRTASRPKKASEG
jgi:hypothetical protein